MTEELRLLIEAAQANLTIAEQACRSREADVHLARLAHLVDCADCHRVDVPLRTDPLLLSAVLPGQQRA